MSCNWMKSIILKTLPIIKYYHFTRDVQLHLQDTSSKEKTFFITVLTKIVLYQVSLRASVHRPVERQGKWTTNLLQVNCPVWLLTFLKFEARQLAWQGKWIEGSSIFEASCLPPPFTCHAWTPTVSTAQLVGMCVLFVSVTVVQFEYWS
jgi:hypothetical protein